MKKRILEICVDSLSSALIAQEAGADRIELCACLDVGGITPDQALFTLVRKKLHIPIHVLIRPRLGDFVYDASEVEVMVESIRCFQQQGADGLVVGALTEQTEIDRPLMYRLMKAASPLPVTFHRAFDQLAHPLAALPLLSDLGVERVLTSGQEARAVDGLSLFRLLLDEVKGTLGILAGGGISSQNVEPLLALGVLEVHASARRSVGASNTRSKIILSSGGLPEVYRFADYQEIVNLRTILNRYEA